MTSSGTTGTIMMINDSAFDPGAASKTTTNSSSRLPKLIAKKRSFSLRRTWSNRSNRSNASSCCSEGGEFASSHPAPPPLIIHANASFHSISETSPLKAATPTWPGSSLNHGFVGAPESTTEAEPNVLSLSRYQTVVGEKLGQGSFCIVNEVLFLHTESDKPKICDHIQTPEMVDEDSSAAGKRKLVPRTLCSSESTMLTFSISSDATNVSVIPSPFLPGETGVNAESSSRDNGTATSTTTTVAKYCMKHLRNDIDNAQIRRGQRDLLVECYILKSLQHRHIIAAVAISRTIKSLLDESAGTTNSVSSIPVQRLEQEDVDEFFLIEERLTGTLRPRLKEWKMKILQEGLPLPHASLSQEDRIQSQNGLSLPPIPKHTTSRDIPQAPKSTGMLSTLLRRKSSRRRQHIAVPSSKNSMSSCTTTADDVESWMDRLNVLQNIASALRYLHEHEMVYRDLKPDNVGFTPDGTLKLFDLGMVRVLQPEDQCNVGGRLERKGSTTSTTSLSKTGYVDNEILYRLTGCTGSPRYMAPEVASNDPYNKKADTYSFGILMWQICALAIPYKGYTFTEHYEVFAVERKRPTLSWTEPWPIGLSQLIFNCWSHDISKRPTFLEICRDLYQIEEAYALQLRVASSKK